MRVRARIENRSTGVSRESYRCAKRDEDHDVAESSFGALMWVCSPRYCGNTDSWKRTDEKEARRSFISLDNR